MGETHRASFSGATEGIYSGISAVRMVILGLEGNLGLPRGDTVWKLLSGAIVLTVLL